MGNLLIRRWVLAALAMQSFALVDTITATTTAKPVVTVQVAATPTPQATHHHHHHHLHFQGLAQSQALQRSLIICSLWKTSIFGRSACLVGSAAQSTTSTIVSTRTATITACPSAIRNCPPSSKTTFVTTETVVVSMTVCPVADATRTTSFHAGGQLSVKPEGPEFAISTIFSTRTATITACPSSVTKCPARSKSTFLTTETIAVITTVCPVADATQTTSPSISGDESLTKSEELGFTTSTVFSTHITACQSSVTDCPARSKPTFVTTETIAISTTVCPITEAAGATQTPCVSGSTGESTGIESNGNEGSGSTISTIWTARIVTVTACPASMTNCPLRSKTTYLTTETVAVGTTAIAAFAQAESPSEGVTVTTQVVGVDSQATESITALLGSTAVASSGSSGAAGGQSGLGSGAAAVYTALYIVESCGNSDTCTEYVKTVVMTQTNVAQPTMISSMFNPVYSSGDCGIPSASAFSAHVGQGSQSSRVSASDASSTSSAAYAVYDGAASGNLQWSWLRMIGTAMLILVAILA